MPSINPLFSLLLGFFCGSIPFGYIAGRLAHTDIRRKGSGNIGFTNVARTLGLKWALPVLLLDIAKGLIPVLLAPRLNLSPPLVGLGAISGHIFTPWLKFNGGKGVATTLGVALVLCPRSFLFCLGVFLLLLLLFGFVSLASLALALLLPLSTRFFYPDNRALFLFTLSTGVLIIIRHLPNIQRLLKGTEPRFGLWQKIFRKEVR